MFILHWFVFKPALSVVYLSWCEAVIKYLEYENIFRVSFDEYLLGLYRGSTEYHLDNLLA